MRYSELLLEKIVNLHSTDEKLPYAAQVWDMLQRSYKKVGGFKSSTSPEELANDPGYWKLVRRGDKITAVAIYKKISNTQNFKSIGIATETEFNPETGEYKATARGLNDFNMVKAGDLKTNRSWVEVSGPAEKAMARAGAKPVSNKYAEFLTGKKIIELNKDGYHYTRLIQGKPYEKIIVGFVNISPQGKEELIRQGFSLEDLPQNIAV